LAQGRLSEAAPLLDESRQILESVLPAGHPQIAHVIGEQGFLRLAQGDRTAAYGLFQQSTELLVRRSKHYAGHESGDGTVRGARYFGGLVTAAFHLAQTPLVADPTLLDAGFRALQWAQHSAAASSLAQMAARNAKQETGLAKLARERQDLSVDWEARDKELVAVSALPAEQRSSDAERGLRQRLSEIESRIAAIDRTLAQGFPEYAALTSPAPLTVAEVQALLSANEVLVVPFHTGSWASTPGATFLWAVSKTESRWVRTSLGVRDLRGHIRALRCGLDHTAWQTGDDGPCSALHKGAYAHGSSKPLPFDVNRAHQLYSALFGQLEPLIRGKDLLFVPSDLMGTLPLHVLVTEKPRDETAYGDAAWLIRKHAITILPTVVSLQSLRKLAKESKATKPFIGFGNPLLVGPDGNDRSAHQHPGCSSGMVAARQTNRGMRTPMSSFFRDGLADVDAVRAQYPLPETADELCAVARATGAVDDAVYLGARATETAIKALSASGGLAQARVLHFATHGLLAGETRRLANSRAEPALILTPPDTPSERDDGLLTASEVAQLKLDADWVVLSACNTASASDDDDDAEALSGLARAFFYAGARALLVSHWAVSSEPTVRLIAGTFDKLAADSKLGRAGALRRSILALITEGGGNAHPATWAPFVVVGEGASR
jgi:CHAT domain-containing protein